MTSAILKTICFALVSAHALSATVSVNWVIPMSPMTKRVNIGDEVEFTWTGGHNVYESASEADFNNCVLTGGTMVGSFSGTKVTMSSAGTRYFICEVAGHCAANQKLAITATAPAGQTCASYCNEQKVVEQSTCVTQCQQCETNNQGPVKRCLNEYLKTQKEQVVKEGRDKAEAAKNTCSSKSDPKERRTCYGTEAAALIPTEGMTATERKAAVANAKEYFREVDEDEMMKKADDMKQNLLRGNLNDAQMEMEKRRMCGLCINGTAEMKRVEGLSDAEKRQAQKVCIDKCVKQTLKDVEASELASCVNTSASRAENSRCFCEVKSDDDARKRLSAAKDADKRLGASEYMCGMYVQCAENDEVDCKDTLNELLMSAKDGCGPDMNSMASEEWKMTLPQLQKSCQQKQVSDSMKQCREALSNGSAKDIGECIADTTRLPLGKVKKLELQEFKKQARDEYLSCKSCNRTASSDCPPVSECDTITRSFIMAQLNSSCAGNYEALIKDGLELSLLEGTDEEQPEVVEIARRACEVLIRFKRGRGACQAGGRMRRALERKIARKGIEVDGVLGLVKGRMSTQIDKGDYQEAKMMFMVHDSMSSSVEPEPDTYYKIIDDDAVETKCGNLRSKLAEAYLPMTRRLADLDTDEDVDEVDSTQATDSCLLGNTSCQEEDLETDDDDLTEDDTTMTSTAAATGSMTTPMATSSTASSDSNVGGDSTSVAPTTAANETVPEHTVALTVTLANISAVVDEATLLQQIEAGLLAAAGGSSAGATVTEVVIEFINVVSVYSNLPQIVVDSIIDAYVAMTGVLRATVKVNDQAHSGDAGGRRLQSDATVKAKIMKQAGADVVQASQAIATSGSVSDMITQLVATGSYDSADLSSMAVAITTELSVTSKVKGTAAPPTVTAIASNIGSSITAGGATVDANSVQVTSTGVSTTPQNIEDDHAPVASLMIAWAAVCYAFVMA